MGRVSAELGRRIYLDTNIVITSEMTLVEALVGPLETQNLAIQQTYRSFLTSTATLVVSPVSRDILEEAAQLRANTKLKLPDAIHLATAIRHQCDSFFTNDDVFKSLNLPQVRMLSDVDLT